MNRTSVLVIAVALLCAACGSAAPSAPGGVAATQTAAAPGPTATLPSVASSAPTSAPASAGPQPDYEGTWGGEHIAGSLKYCGSTANPYWAADMVSGSGDRGFMSFIIPAGSTEPVAGVIDQPFMVDEFNLAAAGTGQFVPGSPPHFIIVNNEGTYDITLQVGDFCQG